MQPFINILETVSSELTQLPQTVRVTLECVPNLPITETVNCLDTADSQRCSADRYWIPWTEELGAWVNASGSDVVLVVNQASEVIEISGALTLGLTSVIAGACLNLQGQVAIHANAIALEELAVAFVGYSGMGKSTLSAYCASRGAGFITDDVLVVDSENLVHPGNPRLKLYPHTGESLGLDVSEETDYKIFYKPQQLGAKLQKQPVPIGIIYLVAESSDKSIYSLPLSPSQAVFDLLTHSYYTSALIPSNPSLLDAYVRLVAEAPVRQLFYPRDFATLPKVYDFLLAEIHHL
jgi:hypothetical protein